MSFRENFTDYSKTLRLAFPIILSQAGQMFTGIVDNMMVGHVDTTSLAAASFANGVFVNVMVFGMGFAFGLTPLVGASIGRKDLNRTGILLKNGLFTNIILSFLLTGILFLFSNLMNLMGQPEDVMILSKPYFYIISVSMIPMMLFFTFKQFTEGVASTKPAMVFTISSNILNIALNYVLIFGKLGFAPMGLLGAGWATLIARIYQGVGFALYVLFSKRYQEFTVGFWQIPLQLKEVFGLAKLGIPMGLQILMEAGAFTIGTIFMGQIGKIELAAHQVVLSLASFTFMAVGGIGSATTIRISNQFGENNYKKLRRIGLSSYFIVTLIMTGFGVLFFIGRNIIPLGFSPDIEVIQVAANLLIFAAIFQTFDGIQLTSM
ncbi:MAG: MATE family efflux transporter, partial [Flammeovirgaceae bacterium]|nr:MATE family efflux transporter [Flammeovirgaceae bacterium]